MTDIDNTTLQEIRNLVILCNIGYSIKKKDIYKPKSPNEIELFETISSEFDYIDGTLRHVNAIATKSLDSHTLYIIIPGTQDIRDFMDNVMIEKTEPNFSLHDNGITFHSGFFKQFTALLVGINKVINRFIKCESGTNIVITGHSLGGAVASIWGYYLKTVHKLPNLKVVTFGAPYFTNTNGSEWFSNNLDFTRVELAKDPIVNIPILYSVGYTHVSKDWIRINRKIKLNKMPKRTKRHWLLEIYKRYSKYICGKKLDIRYHNTDTYIKYLTKHIH